MLLASVFLLGPAFAIGRPIGRTLMPLLPNGLLPSTVFTLLSIGALICYDVATKKRIAPATLWGSCRDRRGLCGDANDVNQRLWLSFRTLVGRARRLTGVASLHTRQLAISRKGER